MSKRLLLFILIAVISGSSYAGKIKLLLGVRAGGGAMLARDRVGSFTSPGTVLHNHQTWTLHAKGEALLGIGRLRIGYQFLYNFSGPQLAQAGNFFTGDDARNTTYFNSSQTHFFGHYLHVEVAVIDLPHFALVPAVGGGTFTGFKVDRTTGDHVQLSSTTHNRWTFSAEVNAEIKFGRVTFLVGPNYYLFSLQDRANRDWREYQHFIGGDVGIRVNLLKL